MRLSPHYLTGLSLCLLPFMAGAAEAGDIKKISQGKRVSLKSHLAKNKYTVFEFYADW